MGQNIFNIGLSALSSYQRALNTTAHNVANVETPGYSRQTTSLGTNSPQMSGGFYSGTGVHVTGTNRMYDSFFSGQMRTGVSFYNEAETLSLFSGQLDSFLSGSPNVSDSLNNFFAGLQEVIKSPSSPASREVFLAQANALASKINSAGYQIRNSELSAQNTVTATIQAVNDLTKQIANLNVDILAASVYTPNDLMDTRDNLIDQLSELISITVITGENGMVTISSNNGMPLVAASQYNQLVAVPDPSDQTKLTVYSTISNSLQQVDTNNFGGKLGGLFSFQTQVVDKTRSMLGAFTLGLSYYMNEQHALGVDLKGRLGGLFFSDLTQTNLIANTRNNSLTSGTCVVTDPSQLSNSDYRITYNGNWMVTRLSDNTILGSFSGNSFDLESEGISINFSGPAAVGDSFIVRPTLGATDRFSVAITDMSKLALGMPILLSSNPNNTGTGSFDSNKIVVNSVSGNEFITPGQLSPPILIRFTSPTTYDILDNTVPGSPSPILTSQVFVPGADNEMLPSSLGYGYQVTVAGTPNTGDEFLVQYNLTGTSDARNAQLLSKMQSKAVLSEGTISLSDAFNITASNLGNITALSRIQRDASLVLVRQNSSIRNSISGVNLDEEASNLLTYKQCYEAAAQMIGVAEIIFSTLLDATGRR